MQKNLPSNPFVKVVETLRDLLAGALVRPLLVCKDEKDRTKYSTDKSGKYSVEKTDRRSTGKGLGLWLGGRSIYINSLAELGQMLSVLFHPTVFGWILELRKEDPLATVPVDKEGKTLVSPSIWGVSTPQWRRSFLKKHESLICIGTDTGAGEADAQDRARKLDAAQAEAANERWHELALLKAEFQLRMDALNDDDEDEDDDDTVVGPSF